MTDKQKNSGVIASRAIVGLMVVCAIAALVYLYQDSFDRGFKAVKLSFGHELIDAEVTLPSLRRTAGQYQFVLNGQQYTGTGGGLRENEAVSVAYLASDPHVNRPANELVIDIFTGLVLPVGVLIGLAATFLPARTLIRTPQSKREQDEAIQAPLGDSDSKS